MVAHTDLFIENSPYVHLEVPGAGSGPRRRPSISWLGRERPRVDPVTESQSAGSDIPLSDLSPPEKAARSGSFGAVASQYERFRPGPPSAAVDWFLPGTVDRVVDIGAGTGALTRMLVDKARNVVAVELMIGCDPSSSSGFPPRPQSRAVAN